MTTPIDPPRPRRRTALIIAGAVTAVLAASAAGAAIALAASGNNTPPAIPASPTSAVPVATLDPKTACVRATNLIATATTDLIGEIAAHPDGSTIDRTKLANTIADMRDLQPSMPERLGGDLGDLIEPLEHLQEVLTTGRNRTIDTGVYRSRGPGIIMACGRYVQG